MMNEEELKQALEHDAQVPASQKFGTAGDAAGDAAGAAHDNGPLSKLARGAACLAISEVIAALRDDEACEFDDLERLVQLAERLDVLADKAAVR